jgi:hypothetical protein
MYQKSFLWHEIINEGDQLEQLATEYGRVYYDGVSYFPSATTMLAIIPKQQYIVDWEARTPPEERARVMQKATSQGTAVHAVLEKYLSGTTIDLSQYPPNVASLARELIEECRRIEIIYASEKFLVNRKLGYAGTVDFAGKVAGENEVWDFKTGRYAGFGAQAPLSYRIQLALYALALEDSTTETFDRGRIILSSTYDGLKVYPIELTPYKKMAAALAKDYWRKHGDKIRSLSESTSRQAKRDTATAL